MEGEEQTEAIRTPEEPGARSLTTRGRQERMEGRDMTGLQQEGTARYRWPRAFASAATRSTSARRSDSFLATHTSHD